MKRRAIFGWVSICLCFVWLVPSGLGSAQSDPLSGTWTGDWGPNERDRNRVVLELVWDGTSLRGTINPGPNAVELVEGTYDPETRAVRMEAQATGFRGPVHYVIEGTLEGGTLSGSWGHERNRGDFRITRSE